MKKNTVLVIDDSYADQVLIAGLLAISGFEVVPAYTSEAAWQWLESHAPPRKTPDKMDKPDGRYLLRLNNASVV